MNVIFKNIWESVKSECPYCGATQIERLVTNVSSSKDVKCFYCHKKYYLCPSKSVVKNNVYEKN